MTESMKYKVIVSDRAKRMLGTHIRFMAQVSKEAAAAKKKDFPLCSTAAANDLINKKNYGARLLYHKQGKVQRISGKISAGNKNFFAHCQKAPATKWRKPSSRTKTGRFGDWQHQRPPFQARMARSAVTSGSSPSGERISGVVPYSSLLEPSGFKPKSGE